MEYRTVGNDENDVLDGQDQQFSPYIQFETPENEHNDEKRIENK